MVVVALLAACSAGGNADSESAPTTGLESTTSSAESTASEPSPSTRSWTTDVVEPLPPESSELPGATDVESACPGVPAGVSRFELEVAGNSYSIRVLTPTARDNLDGPLPVVMNWHGLGSNGFQQAQLTGYEFLAEQEGFLVAHPTGLRAAGVTASGIEVPDAQQGRRSWELAQLDAPGRDDVAMTSLLIDHLVADFCGDETRVYATGMSNGGFFTSLLVCELADRLAAAVSVAGLSHPDSCAPDRPVPFMAFHGTADRVVPYEGGESTLLEDSGTADGDAADAAVPAELQAFFEQSMPDEFDQFAASFGCDPEPVAEPISDDVTAFRYEGCSDDVPLVFHRIDGGGHTWPGAPLGLLLTRPLGETTFDVSATIDGWEFMRRFSLDG